MSTPRATAGLSQDERDLLIELRTQMEGVRVDVKELKDNTAARLALVENNKVERTEMIRLQADADKVHQDFEARIRSIEKAVTRIATWGSAGVLALGIAEFIIGNLWK